MHHDLRHHMQRITPRPRISSAGESMEKHFKALQDSIVTKEDGSQEFRFNADLHQFHPEEIKVKTSSEGGNTVTISAKHEEKTDNSSVFHEFSRSFTLPEGVDPEAVTCSFSKDGVLTIRGPVENAAIEAPPEKKQKTDQE